tara:strand:- start:1071 stop:1247 length:177 start_codon:yes stop_codon:yes gene_type:complete
MTKTQEASRRTDAQIRDASMKVTAYKNYQSAVQHRYDVFYAGEEEIDRLYRIYSDQKG